MEGRARSAPTAGVYAWLRYHRIPRDGDDTPSLALLDRAPRGSPQAERRARLAEASAYRPLPEPPWQLEGETPTRLDPVGPDAALSLRDAARFLGTTSAHAASLAAAGMLRAERSPFCGEGGEWRIRGSAVREFLDALPVHPIPERGIAHAVGLPEALELLAEVRPSLAQLVAAMKAGRLRRGRLTAYWAHPSPALDRLWFSRQQVMEFLWYRREAADRGRLIPAEEVRAHHRCGERTLRIWYASGLLAPCRDRTGAKRVRWWYDDSEEARLREEGLLPHPVAPGVTTHTAYVWKPDELLAWREGWLDEEGVARHLGLRGTPDGDQDTLDAWALDGALTPRTEPGGRVRWYGRAEVEGLERRLYWESHPLRGP